MNESLHEAASLYVLDQLEPRERTLFEARLLQEPELAALVRHYEAALAAGIRSLPFRKPSPMVLENIEDQLDALTERGWSPHSVRAGHSDSAPPRKKPARSAGSTIRWTSLAQWGIAAVIAVSLATLAVQSVRSTKGQPVFVVVGLDADRNTFAELPQAGPVAKDPDARFIQLASTAENLWRNPESRPAHAASPSGSNHGYALFDPASQQGFIAIEQLPALAENQRYHLWVIDAATNRIRDAGILPLAGLSRGLYSFALEPTEAPASDRNRPNFFITVEDVSPTPQPAPQPRGKVVLGKDSI